MLFLARNFINTILVLQCETVNRICQNFSFRAPFSNESVSLFSIHCPLTENFAGILAANANVNYRTQWILNSKCGYSGSKDKPDAWVSCSGFVLNRLRVQTLRTVRFTSDRIIPLPEYWLNWRPPDRTSRLWISKKFSLFWEVQAIAKFFVYLLATSWFNLIEEKSLKLNEIWY